MKRPTLQLVKRPAPGSRTAQAREPEISQRLMKQAQEAYNMLSDALRDHDAMRIEFAVTHWDLVIYRIRLEIISGNKGLTK
jgi:hypothetical protein